MRDLNEYNMVGSKRSHFLDSHEFVVSSSSTTRTLAYAFCGILIFVFLASLVGVLRLLHEIFSPVSTISTPRGRGALLKILTESSTLSIFYVFPDVFPDFSDKKNGI